VLGPTPFGSAEIGFEAFGFGVAGKELDDPALTDLDADVAGAVAAPPIAPDVFGAVEV
jgi:hypothetical protein